MAVYLLGDSIFDNAAYVRPGHSVTELLQARLSTPVRLLAKDGAVTADVPPQVEALGPEAGADDRVFLSAGGNDALALVHTLDLDEPVPTIDLIRRLDAHVMGYREGYQALVARLIELPAPLALTTVYRSDLPRQLVGDAHFGTALLAMVNSVIWEQAAQHGLGVLDAHGLLTEPGDFANVIEPSEQGGAKLAEALTAMVKASGLG